jgi:hypothetical protein
VYSRYGEAGHREVANKLRLMMARRSTWPNGRSEKV